MERKQFITIFTKIFVRKGEMHRQSFGSLLGNDRDVLESLSHKVRKPNTDDDPPTKRFLAAPMVFFESYRIELKR